MNLIDDLRWCLSNLRAIDAKPMKGIDAITLGLVEHRLDALIAQLNPPKQSCRHCGMETEPDEADCSCGDIRFAKYHSSQACGWRP